MKYIIPLLLLITLSCNNELEHKIIRSKSHLTFTGGELPEGICRYIYKNSKYGNYIEFTEKCDKYNVRDTIRR